MRALLFHFGANAALSQEETRSVKHSVGHEGCTYPDNPTIIAEENFDK